MHISMDQVHDVLNELQAASHVNSEGPGYTKLVCLDVPVEELCKQAVEIKTARAKQVKMPKSKLKVIVYYYMYILRYNFTGAT